MEPADALLSMQTDPIGQEVEHKYWYAEGGQTLLIDPSVPTSFNDNRSFGSCNSAGRRVKLDKTL